MTPRILLSTTVKWPSAARLAGAFANVGAHVDAIYPSGHVKARSRFVSGRHIHNPLFPIASLAEAIEASSPDLIVPCDDRAVRHLLELHGRKRDGKTGRLIERSLGRIESYATLLTRGSFIETAASLGIAVPAMARVDDVKGLERALDRIGLPAVLKSDGSWGGGGVVIARTRDQARDGYRRLSAVPSRLRSIVRAFARQDAYFLVDAIDPPRPCVSLQRFIGGKPATSSFACWNGRLLSAIHMDVLASEGATGPASVMRRVDCQQMEQIAQQLAQHFELSGLQGLDYVRDHEGRVHLIEANPRATQASALALGPGHDLPASLAGSISASVRGARPAVTANEVIALFPQEWRRDPDSRWLRTAHLDVPWDDPEVLQACLQPGERTPQPVTTASVPLSASQVLTAD